MKDLKKSEINNRGCNNEQDKKKYSHHSAE
jgi:hypothetical protein